MKLVLSLLLLSGCSFFIKGSESPKTAKNTFYLLPFKESGWSQNQDPRSDYVFEHQDGRILLSNSFCDEFQEGSLKELAHKTFKTVSAFKAVKEFYTTFHHREAYQLEGQGLVDGVKVGLKVLNTRRNNCYFDFVAINPDSSHASGEDFNKFLSAVVFK